MTLPSQVVDRWWTVGVRCPSCDRLRATTNEAQPITLGELAGLLGTEVSWTDEPTTTEALRYLRAA